MNKEIQHVTRGRSQYRCRVVQPPFNPHKQKKFAETLIFGRTKPLIELRGRIKNECRQLYARNEKTRRIFFCFTLYNIQQFF